MTETAAPAPASSPMAGAVSATADAFAIQRLNMVDSQVRPSDITDRRIIRAMGRVPRELFVPAGLRAIAYMDNPVTLTARAPHRYLMEPRLFAKLVQLANIRDGGRVLEIGCATGYGVAVLSAMGCKAFGLDENADLVALASATLAAASIAGAQVKSGPLATGLASDGPFDAIIMSGRVPEVPAALFDQLKTGGRLVAIAGTGPSTRATVWLRTANSFDPREAFDATAAPLPGFAKAAQFVF